MILAGDVGATKTALALFSGDPREPACLETYPSAAHSGLEEIVRAFLAAHPATVEAACFGVAGPVRDGRVKAVNLAWPVEAASVAGALGLPAVVLLNDLEANAYGIRALRPEDLAVLNEGEPGAAGNAAVISAGTGLGEAGLYWDGRRHHPFATEGGHADFAPRSDVELALLRFLRREHPHVSVERVCSGMGVVNLYRFLLDERAETQPAWFREAEDRAAAVSRAALEHGDRTASDALDLLCSIYGAEAGNLALKVMATGGVYVGGGIAPKILPRLRDGRFVAAFADKGRLRGLLERIPVRVILNERAALLGAAARAALARAEA